MLGVFNEHLGLILSSLATLSESIEGVRVKPSVQFGKLRSEQVSIEERREEREERKEEREERREERGERREEREDRREKIGERREKIGERREERGEKRQEMVHLRILVNIPSFRSHVH